MRSGTGVRRRSRRLLTVVALAVAVTTLAACDPTTGRPPPPGASVPAFTSSDEAVGAGTKWSLEGSWYPGCPVPREHLRLLTVRYWGYDGKARNGKLVVHGWLVPAFRQAFAELYDARFQINGIQGVGAFGGSDARSMAANNTSAFNCRKVAGTNRWSEHANGTAIDINPVQNPHVKGGVVDPASGRPWVDRSKPVPGMIRDGDVVVRAFTRAGFRWGGHWSSSKDYMHFSTSGR